MAKAEPQVTTVKMDDGTVVDFPGKRKLQKSSTVDADGVIKTRLDFVNGEFRVFTIPPALLHKFAAHGAEQKLGDHIAGLKGKNGTEADIDDCIFAIDELMDRLNSGEWNATSAAGNGMAGVSVLAKALVEFTGQSIAQIKTFLSAKTQAEKIALRNNPKVKPIVERLEAEKAAKAVAKGPAIDTDALLGQLAGAAPATDAEPALV